MEKILKFKTVLMFSLVLSLFCSSSVFAQGHQEERGHGNAGTINRGSQGHPRSIGHANRHYYHNGNWNRNGWYGWGVPGPVLGDGVLVTSLPPGTTTVLINGNTYFYGNDMYFRQMPAGGFAVVTITN